MNTVICPDCNGTGKYQTWECQLCGGERVIDKEIAEEYIRDWNGYKEMMKEFVDVK